MKYHISYDQFGQVVYLPKLKNLPTYLLKTGYSYDHNLYSNEIRELFYSIARKEKVKQVIMTSATTPYPGVISVTNSANPNGWHFFKNVTIGDPGYGAGDKDMRKIEFNFTFSDNQLYSVYEGGIIASSAQEPPKTMLEGLFANSTQGIIIDSASSLKRGQYRAVKTTYMQGFEKIRIRAVNGPHSVNCGFYLSLAPSQFGDFYIPSAPAMEDFESYVCIKHTNLNWKND